MYLEFESLKEYENYFTKNKLEVARTIAQGISKAHESEKEEALIFEIGFENSDQIVYEVSVEKKEWIRSLDACLDIFTKEEDSDNAIDTFLIKKKLLSKKDVKSL